MECTIILTASNFGSATERLEMKEEFVKPRMNLSQDEKSLLVNEILDQVDFLYDDKVKNEILQAQTFEE